MISKSLSQNFSENIDIVPLKKAYSNYETPLFSKQKENLYGSSVTLESDIQILENKINREQIGNDLKLQWTEKMKEFEQVNVKQLNKDSPITSEP